MADEMWEDNEFGELDGSDVTSPDELYKGGTVNKEGMYHVSVESSEIKDRSDDNKIPCLEIVLLVRAAEPTSESEIGKKTYVRFYLRKWKNKKAHSEGQELMADSTRKSLLRFLYGFTVIDADQFGGRIKWDHKDFEQRQAIVNIEKDDDYPEKDKDGELVKNADGTQKMRSGGFKVKWGNAWRLDDEEVATVPKSDEAIAEFQTYLSYAGEGSSADGVDPLDNV